MQIIHHKLEKIALIIKLIANQELTFRSGLQLLRALLISFILIGFISNSSAQTIGLHVAENHRVLFGTDTIGSGTKLMWIPSKAAFRAGYVFQDNWDIDSIGEKSMSWGDGARAIGIRSTAWGASSNIGSGQLSSVWGEANSAKGYGATAWGGVNRAEGAWSTASGRATIALGRSSLSAGESNTAGSLAEVVLGGNSILAEGNPNEWVLEDRLFVVGNGPSNNERNNALTVLKNGNIGIDVAEPEELLHIGIGGNVLFGDSLQGGGTKMMWIPSKGALRLGTLHSLSPQNWDQDSVGTNSVVWGGGARATGEGATAWGASLNHASADWSTVWGANNQATRTFATAWGGANRATGLHSTVWGVSNLAEGDRSTAFGQSSKAIGYYSTAFGEHNIAKSSYETVLGRYADTSGVVNNPWVWEDHHQLFAIGNGSFTDRNNALTVLKDGKVGINTASPRGHFDINVKNADIYLTDDVNGTDDNLNGNLYLPGHIYIAPFHAGSDISYLQARRKDNSGSTHLQIRTYNNGTLTDAMKITDVGNVDIPGCYMSGGTPVAGTCTSDARLKNNISSLSSQLMLLNQLRPVAYDWIEDTDGNDGEIGLIAQEVEQIIPDMVVTGSDGTKRIKYDISLQIRTIKAIQEQQELITNQALDLEKKDRQIEQLEARLQRIERLLLNKSE